MSGFNWRMDADTGPVHALFDSIRQTMANMEPLYDEVGEIIQNSTQRSFEFSRTPDGAAWPQRKNNVDPGRALLVKTRNLMGHITRRPTARDVTVGTNVIYAAIHQFGGKAGRKHAADIPAREYLGIDPQGWREIIAAGEKFLERSAK